MVDVELNTPVKLWDGGRAGPFLMIPLRQVESVGAALTAAGIKYSRSRDAVQKEGHEPIVLVEFGSRGDAARIQAVLDAN